MEILKNRVVNKQDKVTPIELERLKFSLKACAEEPGDLELVASTASVLMKIGNDIDARLESQLYLLRSLQEGGVLQNIVLDILCWCGWIPRNYQHQILQRGKKASVLTTTLKRQYENDGPKMERYNMEQTLKAFVMCVKTGRPGAEWDMKRMRNWLTACKFECTSCIDPDEKGLMEKLREFRDGINKRKDDVSCCLVTLMAHGGKGVIKTVLDERINLSDIFEMFNNKNCPALQKKPKIFIIQACRGVRRDGGVVQADGEPMEVNDSEKKRLPTFSDYFIIYPTHEGHIALRHPEDGSVMIQAMDEVFQKHGKKLHIVDFFTQVNNRVVHTDFYMDEDPVKVVLVMESTLTKAVYF